MSSDAPAWNSEAVAIATAHTRFARRIHHLSTVSSTNTLALEAAQARSPAHQVWVADEQTAGRGRGGHSWHSEPRAGLYLSALIRPSLPLARALHLSLATGLAVQAAIHDVTGAHPDIRWPNDLLLDGRKFAGILVETAAFEGNLRHAVIGIGLNVGHTAFPEALRPIATSLLLATGRLWSRESLLAAILSRLDEELSRLEAPSPDTLSRFTAQSTWVHGMRVRVGEDHQAYTGVTEGLDPAGFLQVRTGNGDLRTVLSGGVRADAPQSTNA